MISAGYLKLQKKYWNHYNFKEYKMKKVYIFWMILGAIAFGLILFIFIKGESISRWLHENDDIEEFFEKG